MRPLALALLIAAFGVLGCEPDPAELRAVGTLERTRVELVAESNEPIVALDVIEGERVERGDIIARLDDTRLRAQVAVAEASLAEARARLAEAERGPRNERIVEAEARLARAESALGQTWRDVERANKLASSAIESQARLDRTRSAWREARAQRDEATATLEALREGTTKEELDQARSSVAAAEATRAEVQIRLDRLTVRAPGAGVVDALPFELSERPPAGAVVAILLVGDSPYARLHVPAPLRMQIDTGSTALVYVDGRDEPYRGRLRHISREASFTPYFALTQHDRSRLSYLAEVDLIDANAQDLPTGIPVEVGFEFGARTAHADDAELQ